MQFYCYSLFLSDADHDKLNLNEYIAISWSLIPLCTAITLTTSIHRSTPFANNDTTVLIFNKTHRCSKFTINEKCNIPMAIR